VSYRTKHNEANGENNHDGTDYNFSENYGAEGETTDAGIEALRKGQIKNFLLTLFVSRGVPMLLAGDEFRRTQGGNNNAYCQDNATSWYDWRYLEQHQEIYRFTQGLLAFRGAHPVLSKEEFYTDADIQWFGPQGGAPDWGNPQARQLGCLVREDEASSLCLLFNAAEEAVDFNLPPLPAGNGWWVTVDTAQATPQDLNAAGKEPPWDADKAYPLPPRSSALLMARGTNGQKQQTASKQVK
jgi:isoamylase